MATTEFDAFARNMASHMTLLFCPTRNQMRCSHELPRALKLWLRGATGMEGRLGMPIGVARVRAERAPLLKERSVPTPFRLLFSRSWGLRRAERGMEWAWALARAKSATYRIRCVATNEFTPKPKSGQRDQVAT